MTEELTQREVSILKDMTAAEARRLDTIESMEKRIVKVQERLEEQQTLIQPAQEAHNERLLAVYDAAQVFKAANSEASKTKRNLMAVESQVSATGGQITSTLEIIERLKNGGI